MRGEICSECGEPATRDTEFCVQCGAFLDWSDNEQEPVEDQQTEPSATVATGGSAGSDAAARAADAVTVPPARGPEPARQTAGARVASAEAQRPAPLADPPPARKTAVEPAVVEPAPPHCRRCGTDNPPELRFCRKCGLEFSPPRQATAWDAQRRPRVPWWRRIFGDPIGWAQTRWYDFKGTVEPVRGVTPTLDPPATEDPVFAAINATDGNEATAWATTWLGTGETTGCGVPRTNAGLLLTFDAAADLREFQVLAGLPAGDPARLSQNRPRVLELRFSDGKCVTTPVRDSGNMHVVELSEPVSTTSVRVDVVDVFPVEGATLVAVSEIEFRQRPPS
jgi:hypothetical protein